ncbi:hypothetical protein NBRC116494_06790 [Aurantivibrio plasticivorans]
MKKPLTESELKNAYIKAAKIISKYGDIYLPIFERLEQEYQSAKKKSELIKKAISIAKSHQRE